MRIKKNKKIILDLLINIKLMIDSFYVQGLFLIIN
jgi:hypothetical protein